MGLFNWIIGFDFKQEKNVSIENKKCKQIIEAVHYFQKHNITPTIDGIEQYTGIDEETIRKYYKFDYNGVMEYD